MAADLQWGTSGTPTPYPITDDAREALKELGIDVGEHLVLNLRSATGREREKFQKRLSRCKTLDDQREFVTDLVLKRMDEGTDRRIVQEVLLDADDTALNQLMYAFVNGVVPDPKALAGAVERTLAQSTPRMLAALAAK